MSKQADLLLEWLSIRLPLASGNVHSNLLRKYLRGDIKTVLDVGCGRGVFPAYRQAVSTGIDIYDDSLARAKEYGNYNTLIKMDVTKLDFPEKSYDAVTSIEVIEHLDKIDGRVMLEKIEKIARKLVIISTPYGFDPCMEKEYNKYLLHRSGWLPAEFEARGYKIIPDYTMKLHAWNNYQALLVLLYGLTVIGQPLTRLNPSRFCNGFMAVKYL